MLCSLHCVFFMFFFFFFSSRRRHTRCSRDWSSDVCSSDLRPVWKRKPAMACPYTTSMRLTRVGRRSYRRPMQRSEEHTSELQSRLHLVCRLLLEKKKKKLIADPYSNTICDLYSYAETPRSQ